MGPERGGRMKSIIKPALITFAFLILALFILERSCNSPDERYFELKGQYESYKEKTEKEDQETQKREAEREAEITKKEAEISTLKDKILDLEEERGEIAKKDSEKASRIKELEAQREPLTDKDSIIINLDLQITEWKERFFNEREDKNKVIEQRDFWARIAFKENSKYLSEKEISKGLRESCLSSSGFGQMC
jgi:septal ring factor EnvC (AmiA/AmiB activator)